MDDEGWLAYSLSLESEGLDLQRQGSLAIRDVARLAAYLRYHLGPDHPHEIDSAVCAYVPLELDFTLEAVGGELESWDDGYATIRVMISRFLKPGGGRIYQGVEGTVETAEIVRFCAELDRLVRLGEGGRDSK